MEGFAHAMPRGFADLKDQLRRSAAATVRHIAEGAHRIHPRDKAARFVVAKGEVGECDAALAMAAVAGLPRQDDLRKLADRIAAMLTGLIRRERARARATGDARTTA